MVPWPVGGVNRRFGYVDQERGTTPNALNVRTNDTILGRERGGSRPGLVRVFDDPAATVGGRGINMMATVRYVEENHIKSRLVLAAGGSLYKENDAGNLVVVASSPEISRWNTVQATDFQNKLYIANSGRSVSGDWISHQTASWTRTTGVNWASGGNYRALNLTGNDEANARLALDTKPLVYDPVAGTLAVITETAGTAPTGCQIICSYAGRIVLAGSYLDPQQWYMSAIEDPLDYDYAGELRTSAVSGTNSLAGKIAAPITAVAPHLDLCLVFGCRTSMWILKGDPITGQMDNLSYEIGIVDKDAWCVTADGWMVFLSHDGVYQLPADCGARRPESLSREKIPESLIGIDPADYCVTFSYDVRERGIHIFVTPYNRDQTAQHWFLDWEMKAFWPVTIQEDHDPFTVCHRRDLATDKSQVFLGCRDGYVRYFDAEAEDDDGTNFDSYAILGPFKGGDEVVDGVVSAIRAKLGSNSGNVTWTIHKGNTAEEAYGAASSYSGTWTLANMQAKQYPRILASEFFVKLSGDPGSRWAIERVIADLQTAGEQRR